MGHTGCKYRYDRAYFSWNMGLFQRLKNFPQSLSCMSTLAVFLERSGPYSFVHRSFSRMGSLTVARQLIWECGCGEVAIHVSLILDHTFRCFSVPASCYFLPPVFYISLLQVLYYFDGSYSNYPGHFGCCCRPLSCVFAFSKLHRVRT